jgi:NADH-quinone oxidoreductase subunit A
VLDNYIPIGMMICIAVAFGVVMSKASEIFGPKNSTEEKLSTYESGMEPVRTAQERFSVRFYLIAMLFIVFDIEVVFLYPWAVNFRDLGVFGFLEMLVFMAILMAGLLYVWKKGALDWSRATTQPAEAPREVSLRNKQAMEERTV